MRCWLALVCPCYTDLLLFDGFVLFPLNSAASKQQVKHFWLSPLPQKTNKKRKKKMSCYAKKLEGLIQSSY